MDTFPLAEQLWPIIYYVALLVQAISSMANIHRWRESYHHRSFLRNISHSDILHYAPR